MIMKKGTEPDQYVEARLVEWGEWYRKGNDSGIGFPHRNILTRLREEGGILISGTGARSLPENPAAEEIEKLVGVLSTLHADRAIALRINYFYTYPPEIKAKWCKWSKQRFQRNLKYAREWIKGYLSARKKYF